MASNPVPRWWGEYESARRVARAANDRERGRREREYRALLMEDLARDGLRFAARLRSGLLDTSELSSADIASLRADALTIGAQLAATEAALRCAEARP